jgi:hypothetical protein
MGSDCQKLLIGPVCSNPDADIDHHSRTKRLVSLGLCFTLSLVLIFGSINSLSFTPLNNAFAAHMDMEGDSGGDSNQGGDSGDGEDSNDDDSSDGMPKDAPQTTGALTAGGDSDNDDDDDNESGGRDNDEDNNNDNEPTSKDAPETTETATTKKLECPKGQEVTLFSTSCEPVGGADADTACPASPTPTSYGVQDQLSVTESVWGFSKSETEQQDKQESLLYRVQIQTTERCPPTKIYSYEPPAVLPYQGNEVDLIESYANPDPSAVKSTVKEGRYTFTTFKDQTVKTTTSEIDVKYKVQIEHTKITPGPGTPLDKLKVVQIELPSTHSYDGGPKNPQTPPNVRETEGDKFLHKISYKDGTAIVGSHGYTEEPGGQTEDIDWIEVYDPKQKLSSYIEIDPVDRRTVVGNMHDNSYTVYPEKANAYTVYPRAADGTQKTVTVTSEGQPVVTVRDANNNIIPPKE